MQNQTDSHFFSINRFFQLLISVAILAGLFALFVLFYGRALSLPFSLLDDYPMRELARAIGSSLKQHGFVGLFSPDAGGPYHNFYRPTVDLLTFAQYRVANWMPFHGLRLLTLALTLMAVFVLPMRAINRGKSGYFSALFGATVAVCLCIVAEVPGSVDYQSLHACWYRLHVTDCYSTFFAVLAILSFIGAWYSRSKTLIILLPVLGSTATLAIVGTKLSFAPVLILPVWVCCCAFIMRKRLLGVCTLFSLIAILAGLWLYICLYTQLLTTGLQGNYIGEYGKLSLGTMRATLLTYKDMLRAMLDPLFLWLALSLLVRYNRIIHLSRCRFWGAIFTEGLLLLVAFALMIGYAAWPHISPRYMLGTTFTLCTLIGLTAGRQMLIIARGEGLVRLIATFVLIPAGMLAVLFIPGKFLFVAMILIIMTFWRTSSRYPINAFLFGMFCIGTAYTCYTSTYSIKGLQTNYIAVEKLRTEKVMQHCFDLWNANKTIGVAVTKEADVRNEILGSMVGLYHEEFGKEPPAFVAVRDLATSSSVCDVLLCASLVTSQDLITFLAADSSTGTTVMKTELPPARVGVPFSDVQRALRNRDFTKIPKSYPAPEFQDSWYFYPTK